MRRSNLRHSADAMAHDVQRRHGTCIQQRETLRLASKYGRRSSHHFVAYIPCGTLHVASLQMPHDAYKLGRFVQPLRGKLLGPLSGPRSHQPSDYAKHLNITSSPLRRHTPLEGRLARSTWRSAWRNCARAHTPCLELSTTRTSSRRFSPSLVLCPHSPAIEIAGSRNY
jgi:hypothetical protein